MINCELFSIDASISDGCVLSVLSIGVDVPFSKRSISGSLFSLMWGEGNNFYDPWVDLNVFFIFKKEWKFKRTDGKKSKKRTTR